MQVEQILERINKGRKATGEKEILFDTLSEDELGVILKIATDSEAKELTIGSLKEHITSMKKFVETELTNEKMERFSFWSFLFNFKKEYALKSRLRNYMLLEDLLLSPERIRNRAEQQLGAMIK